MKGREVVELDLERRGRQREKGSQGNRKENQRHTERRGRGETKMEWELENQSLDGKENRLLYVKRFTVRGNDVLEVGKGGHQTVHPCWKGEHRGKTFAPARGSASQRGR